MALSAGLGAPFKHWDLPEALERIGQLLQQRYPDGDRQYVGIFQAVPLCDLDPVENACAQALSMQAISKKVVLNLLHRSQQEPLAEAAERRLRSIRYRLSQAQLLAMKDLDSFRFADAAVDEPQIRSLYEGDFLEQSVNLIFVGGTGTGKTHLAIAANLVRKGAHGCGSTTS